MKCSSNAKNTVRMVAMQGLATHLIGQHQNPQNFKQIQVTGSPMYLTEEGICITPSARMQTIFGLDQI